MAIIDGILFKKVINRRFESCIVHQKNSHPVGWLFLHLSDLSLIVKDLYLERCIFLCYDCDNDKKR